MLFSEAVEAVKGNHLARQLLYMKRCFGSHSSIGIVVGPGCKTDNCSTISQLVEKGHVKAGLEWLDPFLAVIPPVNKFPDDDFLLIPKRYDDDGPDCPWDIARQEQENARNRAIEARLVVLRKATPMTKEQIGRMIKRLVVKWGVHPFEINQGYCEEFAEEICKQIDGATEEWGDEAPHLFTAFHSPDVHCYIVYDGRYYDAEEPYGVDSPNKLPLYNRQLN